MNMIENSKKPPADAPEPNERADTEEELDEAIADSMIASDPPAIVSKGEPTAPPRRPRPEENDKGKERGD